MYIELYGQTSDRAYKVERKRANNNSIIWSTLASCSINLTCVFGFYLRIVPAPVRPVQRRRQSVTRHDSSVSPSSPCPSCPSLGSCLLLTDGKCPSLRLTIFQAAALPVPYPIHFTFITSRALPLPLFCIHFHNHAAPFYNLSIDSNNSLACYRAFLRIFNNISGVLLSRQTPSSLAPSNEHISFAHEQSPAQYPNRQELTTRAPVGLRISYHSFPIECPLQQPF